MYYYVLLLCTIMSHLKCTISAAEDTPDAGVSPEACDPQHREGAGVAPGRARGLPADAAAGGAAAETAARLPRRPATEKVSSVE